MVAVADVISLRDGRGGPRGKLWPFQQVASTPVALLYRQLHLVTGTNAIVNACHLDHPTCITSQRHPFVQLPCQLPQIGRVAIGRASQPFPRSKPGGPLSRHPAFQLGRPTWQGRVGRHRPRGAPVGLMVAHRHLPAALHPFACRSVGIPWRTFTMSCPLQPGIGLLRRLRPPGRALAFSRPPHGGKAAWEFPSSSVNDVIATRSCLLYAGWIRDNMCTV